MKKFVCGITLFAFLVIGLGSFQALAQTKKLKGNWIFTTAVTGLGTFPVPLSFKNKGKGTVSLPPTPLNMVYNEDGANFSLATEVPKASSPTGAAFTIVIRGAKTTDNSVMGKAIIITSTADSSATGFMQLPGMVTGQRQ